MGHRIRLTATAAFVSVVLTSGAATHAQDSAADSPADAPQEITVTGSRIRRESGFDYPVPVAVISGKDLNESGYTVLGDALANLPQALNSTGIQNSSSTLFNSGQSRVDLRGLNSVRTLVLIDGRRVLTGDFRTSAVDLNLIPSTMIERTEAISGGASAVYGSEAIAGVVNIILRKNYDGIELDVQGGMTEENDGEEWKASAGYGMSFAGDRGHFVIGTEYGKVEPVLQIDRDWAFPGVRRNTAVNPQTVVGASRSNTTSTATFQLINSNTATARSASIAPDRSAVIANSANCRTATVNPLCQDEHLFYSATYNALQGGLERLTGRTYIGFDLTDHATLYTDLSYARAEGEGIFQPAFSNAAGGGTMPVVMRGDNAYLNGTGTLATQLRGFWQQAGLALTQNASANVGKFWEEFGNRDSEVFRESYRSILGVNGGFDLFDRKIDYDAYGQYSKLNGYTIGFNTPNVQRVGQSTDAVMLNGQIVCRNAAARAAGCVPWDLLNGPSAEAVAWSNANARADGEASQTVFAADVSTSLFRLPAGAVGFAMGIEHRKEESDQVQDALTASGALFYNALGRTQGEYDINEAYAELVVPILKDLPFAHRLSVEAAGRLGDYSTVGSVNQWRIAADWAPVRDIRFRASTAMAVRAPNITELYGPQGQNFTTAANDPCDRSQIAGIPAGDSARRATRVANCAAAIPGYDPNTFVSNFGTGRPSLALLQGGNPDLTEETADTYTVGFVVNPRWVADLQVSFDYFDIKVDDAVNTIPINTLLQNLCYDVAQTPASSNRFCGLIARDPTGAATGGLVGGGTSVVLTNQNVQSIETQGYDISVSYSHDFGSFGAFQVRLDGTKTIQWDLQGVPGGPTTEYAGIITGVNGAVPEWKVLAGLGWSFRQFAAQLSNQYLSSMGVSETLSPSSLAPFDTGNYWQHDLRATYQFSKAFTGRLGVINLTDEHPPQLPETATGSTTGGSVYDNRGRWFFVGGNYSFK